MSDNAIHTISFGSVEPRMFSKFENGRMVAYSFAIHRDINGLETHRTSPEPISSIGYDYGKPFTADDHNDIVYGNSKNKGSFIGRLFRYIRLSLTILRKNGNMYTWD